MNIYQKLLQAKKKVPYLQKNKKNFQYTYVSPSNVFATINPILNDLGLILITSVVNSKSQRIEIETKNGIKKEWLYDLDILFSWVDTETGEKLDIPFKASGCNGEEKGLGSALTYAERYFVLKQFNIPTDDDDPDAFDKKMQPPPPPLKPVTVSAATADLYASETIEQVAATWTKYKQFQMVEEFKAAKEFMKVKFTPQQPTPEPTT